MESYAAGTCSNLTSFGPWNWRAVTVGAIVLQNGLLLYTRLAGSLYSPLGYMRFMNPTRNNGAPVTVAGLVPSHTCGGSQMISPSLAGLVQGSQLSVETQVRSAVVDCCQSPSPPNPPIRVRAARRSIYLADRLHAQERFTGSDQREDKEGRGACRHVSSCRRPQCGSYSSIQDILRSTVSIASSIVRV
jgi:hypothetical protein